MYIIVDISTIGGGDMERMGKIINRLATLNRNDSNQRLKEYNLTGNEGSILMILKKNPEIYQEDIIKELQVDKSAVTRLLQNMVNKNLVKRIQSPDDKRYYLIAITKQGLEKQKLVDNIFSKKDRDIVAGLSKNEQIELRRMLDIIKYNLEGGKISE